MQVTTVTSFKALISAYMRQVKGGEELLITERGRTVVRVAPIEEVVPLSKHLLEMENRGQLQRPRAPLPTDFWDLSRPSDPDAKVRLRVSREREQGR